MTEIRTQVHDKFKVFAGNLGDNRSIEALAGEVSRFVSDSGVAAKSIGVEYIESAGRLLITLGYREGEESYPVTLSSVSLGRTEDLKDRSDFADLERAIGEASAGIANIICHELFVTEDHEIIMVFMSHQA
jgi:hypothetical protein